ncbi:molybdenum cofactor synthesis domain-containing protein [Allomyces macrogynus ATCC 38327]|uniref:Molybdenum cofactor synthesis domain-containing protein n=1 Tax=Allomyces macrogynus (strain ATCC 38327) TaxID=578462 RepID=A0A0L0SUS4_ALLM3|nr:molybdenum cofactor synthesis domain-containing protein [Allomyces macrogynus ATCC 38327]|eukprot:KNE66140.1 molybdenum cofactor synthesis domain-containing protein [Allomyces macrogynus ATCC 38327]
MSSTKTAAICIIGDEILSGKTQDTNTNWLAKQLFDLGVDLKRVEVIPDDEADIIETVVRMSRTYNYVFTSGGIGPTHDDITYASIAKAFGCTLEDRAAAEREPATIVAPSHTDPGSMVAMRMTSARLRMAQLPYPSTAHFTPGLWVPLCVVNGNVHILPGIPRLFQAMLAHYLPDLANRDGLGTEPFYRRAINTNRGEGDIADALTAIQDQYAADGIKIGSYPTFGAFKQGGYRVCVTVVGRNVPLVDQVTQAIAEAIDGRVEPLQTPKH